MEKIKEIKSLPAIALRGIIPIPNNDLRTEIGRAQSINAMNVAEKECDSMIILLIQKNPSIEVPKEKDIEEFGVLAKIVSKIKLPNGNFKVKFKILTRVKIVEYIDVKPYFGVEYEEISSISGDYEEEMALLKIVAKKITDDGAEVLLNFQDIMKEIKKGVSTEFLADLIACNLKILELSKMKYLKEANLNNRLKFILEDIEKEKYQVFLENKINMEVKKSIDESQKEYYLREKMKAIQNELGDKAKKEEEIEDLREKIKHAKMPKKIEKKCLDELQRYVSTPSGVAEAGIIKAYLDFVVSLPYKKASIDNQDLKVVKERLDLEHFALEKVKERIIEYLAVKIMTNKNPQTILCLVGPPGVGKTTLAMSIAKALDRKFVKQSLGGIKDESEIRGHRRTYIGALPGRILKGMQQAGTINPVFLLDEIDKMASDYKGDPASAMLEVLDPEQNAHFSDNYVEEQYDLSQVLFITTANYLGNIPAPLRDRMEIVEVSSYTEHEKFNIAKKHLVKKQLENHGLNSEQCIFTDDALYYIIRHYTREAGVRDLSRNIASIVRKSVKEILLDKVEVININVEKVVEYLGKPIYDHNNMLNDDQVGVVTGLAYTEFGGDTLDVEVTYYKGNGGLVLTGKLGDVMKESAQTALSFVKSNADKFGIDQNIFKENDIHIHVPEGAIPKDGPSAGVTMATAIISALTNRLVRKDVGMTGEITLRGCVLPIGGLKEKSIAAHRTGLKQILIPKENERDINDIPKEVLDNLTVTPISSFDEILKYALR